MGDAADPLYRDPDLAQFYDLANPWGPDLAFCEALAADARSVLDLGCGTGQLAARLAAGRETVGADPAAAMVSIGRARPGGDRVTWVVESAETLRLGRRFDLVVLTGHAFQVFLTDAAQEAVMATIASHLAPGGRFIFDCRNPARECWREWTPEKTRERIEHPALGPIEVWNEVAEGPGPGIVTYWTRYREVRTGRLHEARSMIRFTPRARIEALIASAGLFAERWMGDWHGGPCTAGTPEIIPIGRPASGGLRTPQGAS